MDRSAELSAQSTVDDDLIHDVRNGLAGVYAAMCIVRDAMHHGNERDLLTAAIRRMDGLNRRLPRTD
jgi:hypothetical protein